MGFVNGWMDGQVGRWFTFTQRWARDIFWSGCFFFLFDRSLGWAGWQGKARQGRQALRLLGLVFGGRS